MRRSCFFLIFLVHGLLQTAPAAEPEAVKILAQGPWTVAVHTAGNATRERQTVALRSEQELARVAGAHALAAVRRSLKVDAIDFDKQMLLAVADGTLPMVGVSGGGPPSVPNRVEIARLALEDEGKTLHVFWRLSPRAKEDLITCPLAVVLVEKFAGEVKFERLAARTDATPTDDKPAGKEFKIVARAFWPDGWQAETPAKQWTIKSRDELIDPRLKAPENVLERLRQENAARYARALKVDAIDFDKQMIVGVSAGVQSGTGYRVEVVRVEKDADKSGLTVYWKVVAPKQKGEDGLSHPAAVALVEKSDLPVRFAEEPGREKGSLGK